MPPLSQNSSYWIEKLWDKLLLLGLATEILPLIIPDSTTKRQTITAAAGLQKPRHTSFSAGYFVAAADVLKGP